MSYSRTSCSALRPAHAELLWPRLTSGDSSQRLSTLVARRQSARSPRVLRTHLHAYACRIYVTTLRASTGLCVYVPAHPAVPPLSASCSSGQRFAYSFLQIPPRGGHPCRSANTSPCRVCRGLAPQSKCALPSAHKRRPPARVASLAFHAASLPHYWICTQEDAVRIQIPRDPPSGTRLPNVVPKGRHESSPGLAVLSNRPYPKSVPKGTAEPTRSAVPAGLARFSSLPSTLCWATFNRPGNAGTSIICALLKLRSVVIYSPSAPEPSANLRGR